MRWFSFLLGLLLPVAYQAFTGRTRVALKLLAAMVGFVIAVYAWAPLTLLAPLIPLASAIDAGIAGKRGARFAWAHFHKALVLIALMVGGMYAREVYVLESLKGPSSSMMPTLGIGDHFIVRKLSAGEVPSHGELIVFEWPPNRERLYVGRVVARDEEVVEIQHHQPIVNGKPAQQTVIGERQYAEALPDGEPMRLEVLEVEEQMGDARYRIYKKSADRTNDTDGDTPQQYKDEEPRCTDEGVPHPLELNAAKTACVVPKGMVFVLGDNRWNSNDSRRWGAVPASHVRGTISGIWWPGQPVQGMRWSRLGNVQ